MFRFTIRDLLWLMVGMAVALWQERRQAQREKQMIMEERDAAVANERRIGELKAREMAGRLIIAPARQAGPRQVEKVSNGAIVD